ncbi:hypothetical protein OV207_35610 [Corallococcus sp. BB11-1]|uniref:SitA5 family polymorphic toxin n=1 Tax=Corallococcus sp. BB11-1 TaxID=2996783 RepID=UPI00226D4866|nr:hypothetical protein [Corallococcus sp. BB11-1]MCY1036819.1 hypothetical protein [Corallococcus sp. BB11-1]
MAASTGLKGTHEMSNSVKPATWGSDMRLRWAGVLLLGTLLAGCATSRVVYLDTGQGKPIVYSPPRSVDTVEVDAAAFQQVMTRLVLDMRFSLRPEEETRMRARLASWEPESRGRRNDSGAWCSRQDQPEECLSLLEDGFTFLDARARRQMALSFAWDGVWEGVQGAVSEIINPLALKAMITSAMAAYMLLVVAPEPVTKLVAIALTTYVIAYIGLDSFANLIKGWQRLSQDSERAVAFDELEDAGRAFGKVMGQNGARILILALTAALGGGTANLATKGPMLPGFAQAALAAETNAGFQLSAAMVGGVRSISIAEGVMAVGLAPNAVAMVARGPGSRDGGISVKDMHVDLPKHHLDRLAPTWAEQRQVLIEAVRQLDGKVSPLSTNASGAVFEGTLQVKDALGMPVNLTLRWFRYLDGTITLNTAFIAP